ncbi:hypothetical protein BD626DRAFT_473543 [Schizophyllum amplum]|uniref:Secreted protein n=1 Tax=Schizophyllum amplum TaxID=97359 RepID=A0A550CWW2_9AGAR|nr:hypothetical protein BD626DRAFT_473543 [Auriculariopsis ampla]
MLHLWVLLSLWRLVVGCCRILDSWSLLLLYSNILELAVATKDARRASTCTSRCAQFERELKSSGLSPTTTSSAESPSL